MDSLLFSLGATLPIFLVMLVGYFLKRLGMMKPDFTASLNKLNYKVTLPVLLFTDLAGTDIRASWDTRYVLYCFLVTLFCITVIWSVSGIVLRQKETSGVPVLGEFVQGSYRGSAAVLGIAFLQNIYGTSLMGPLMILGTVPLYNIMAVVILSFTAPGENHFRGEKLKETFFDVLKNPIIISIFLGILFSFLRIDLPVIIDTSLDMIARLATPLALLALGGGFEGRKALRYLKPTFVCAFIKLVLQPLIFLPLAISLDFRGEALVAILVMLGAPTTASCYIMAKNMNHEGTLTSSVVVATTFLSSVTLTSWLFLLKYLGFV